MMMMQEFVVRKFHMDMLKCALKVKFRNKPYPDKPKIAITI